jgi:hypothetical protein
MATFTRTFVPTDMLFAGIGATGLSRAHLHASELGFVQDVCVDCGQSSRLREGVAGHAWIPFGSGAADSECV